MKKIIILFFIVIILCINCKKKEPVNKITKNEVSAEKIWERITKEDNYKKYKTWTDHGGLQPGQSPHGRYHRVFINSILSDAVPINNKIAPFGSIIVKENYDSGKKLVMYTVMAKIEGYNPDRNDWFWVKYGSKGEVQATGRLEKCAKCHVTRKSNDYIILHKLDEE